MSEPQGDGNQSWQCPYCQFLTSEPWDGSTHYDVCPFATNWWTVGPDEPGPQCALCKKRLVEGQTYRYIPLYQEPDPDEAERLTFTKQLFELKEVCGFCSLLKRVS